MRKQFFIIRRCANAGHDCADQRLEEVHLYAIGSMSLDGVFELVSTLPPSERYALFKSYYTQGSRQSTPDVDLEDIRGYRERALETVCRGMLRKEPRLISHKASFSDPHMSHRLFRGYIDDYLADELNEEVKGLFEDHLLACDMCGSLFLISRDIVEVLNKCGDEIFEDLVMDEACTLQPDTDEQADGFPPPRKNDPLGSIMHGLKKCPHQFGFAFLLLDNEALPFFSMLSRFMRSGCLSNQFVRMIRLIAGLLRWFVP
ncbi:MAG: hypothetical protein ACMUIS_10755 [bacterium]